jgi:hypothetical protein
MFEAEQTFTHYLQILRVQTNAQFFYYVFHSYLAPTCFSLNAMIRKLTPILPKLTAIKSSYNTYAHQTYRS